MRRALAPAALALLLAACGGSGDDGASLVATSTVAPAAATTTTPLPGDTFTDPEGTYTLLVSPDWALGDGSALADGIEVWKVAPAVDGFAANVNVITQSVGDADLQQYLDANEKGLGSMTVIDVRTVDTGTGELGLFEYKGLVPGATRELHFLAVVAVGDGKAVLATLTATEDAFVTLRPTVERYLLTLRRT